MSSLGKQSVDLQEKYKLVADTIRLYPNQIKQSWDDVKFMQIPADYKNIDNIIFCGMGGSALGARIVESYSFKKLRVPLKIISDYDIPNYAGKNSLIVISSYSGTTEEPINCAYQAMKIKAKMFGITTGKTLADILKREKIPAYIFDPTFNPSNQPRMSIGYALGSTLSLFNKIGIIAISDEEINEALSVSFNVLTEYHENAPSDKNPALNFAKNIVGKIPVLVASEHLTGVAYTIKNQFNENAKNFSVLFEIPELNHHLMEGLRNPAKQRELLKFIFINSELYNDKIIKRYSVTSEVLDKNSVDYISFIPRSKTHLSQIFETLIFGSFVVYYLTKMQNIEPLEIPWVDFFKNKLAKR